MKDFKNFIVFEGPQFEMCMMNAIANKNCKAVKWFFKDCNENAVNSWISSVKKLLEKGISCTVLIPPVLVEQVANSILMEYPKFQIEISLTVSKHHKKKIKLNFIHPETDILS